ncbi:AraC family transcriptional regulator [Brevibacillus sp. Leaf182]|uniref:AraC family transcriptional regulator n=1 Tax=Brevibacillus sp. Leaf182 TaxID=1736290 RepID=UPI0006F891C6|nr:AraC family transcriptional regulator [Brevibacillus sp. Leaf182]RAT96330.1 Fe3+-hydroxamate ABC transporter substrate-binding protein [Brevibacillus sp. Leaf182]
MLHSIPPQPLLGSLHFQLCKVERTASPSPTPFHTLLFFTKGYGSLRIHDQTISPLAGKCFLLSPSTPFAIESLYDSTIDCYQISFTVILFDADNRPHSYPYALLDGRIELSAHPSSRLLRLCDALLLGSSTSSEMDSFWQQLRFQKLLGFLLEQNLSPDLIPNKSKEVENSIRYIQQNYQENITVKQLAQLANVPSWQYTLLFRQLTGKKPLEYVTEQRIHHAKKLLKSSNDSLRDIASQVGFTDEYYFNRRFRKSTGYTPRQYSRLTHRRELVQDWAGHEVEIPLQPQRIIYIGETFNDLLALQVENIVGGNFTWMERTIYRDRVRHMQDIAFPVDYDYLTTLKPDLIIFANAEEDKYKQMSRIAPTLSFHSFASLEERLHTLGDWLGKKDEAREWLRKYHTNATTMWNQLRSELVPGETASVFIHEHGGRLFVMGTSGLSSALYHPNGFSPVDKIQKVLQAGYGFIEIREEDIPLYAGDRIFMLLSEDPESRQATTAFIQSERWHSLPAVQNGYVYFVEAQKWNYGAALTRERLLHMLPRLLRHSS